VYLTYDYVRTYAHSLAYVDGVAEQARGLDPAWRPSGSMPSGPVTGSAPTIPGQQLGGLAAAGANTPALPASALAPLVFGPRAQARVEQATDALRSSYTNTSTHYFDADLECFLRLAPISGNAPPRWVVEANVVNVVFAPTPGPELGATVRGLDGSACNRSYATGTAQGLVEAPLAVRTTTSSSRVEVSTKLSAYLEACRARWGSSVVR
jgi:hypothetical protein